jgi:hypothetical protein
VAAVVILHRVMSLCKELVITKATHASRERDRQAGRGPEAVGLLIVDEEPGDLRAMSVRAKQTCTRRGD